jgi:hypothetical protein
MQGRTRGIQGRYSLSEVVEAVTIVISENPKPHRICTSHIERRNLTIRMQIRRLTRLTNAFSKQFENHKGAIALHFAYYNFVKIHQTLACDSCDGRGDHGSRLDLSEISGISMQAPMVS